MYLVYQSFPFLDPAYARVHLSLSSMLYFLFPFTCISLKPFLFLLLLLQLLFLAMIITCYCK